MTGTSQGKSLTPIRIAQLNAQKKKDAVTKLLNHHVQDFDIIILQEPAWGFIGNDEGMEIRGPIALGHGAMSGTNFKKNQKSKTP